MPYYATNGHISTSIIDGGIEITAEQYSAALAGILAGKIIRIDGGFDIIDPPEPAPEPEPPTFEDIKTALCAQVDYGAETARLKYITSGSGQAMTYTQKATEAAACLGDPDPQPESYALLSAEIGITAGTLIDVAQVVFNAHQAWRIIGAQIEALRLGAKAAINDAETIENAEAAAMVEWP